MTLIPYDQDNLVFTDNSCNFFDCLILSISFFDIVEKHKMHFISHASDVLQVFKYLQTYYPNFIF